MKALDMPEIKRPVLEEALAILHDFKEDVQLNALYRGRLEAQRLENERLQALEEANARAEQERARADEERARADEERARADEERQRAEELLKRNRELEARLAALEGRTETSDE